MLDKDTSVRCVWLTYVSFYTLIQVTVVNVLKLYTITFSDPWTKLLYIFDGGVIDNL